MSDIEHFQRLRKKVPYVNIGNSVFLISLSILDVF